MRIDQISANIRYRTPWEGLDLGFVMGRHWFWPLWRLWWLTALPVTLLLTVLLQGSPAWAAFLVWWCKPLYEPMLLFWLSRRLFGEELSWREVAGQWRAILKPRLLANLTLFRLSPNRSFYMPVSHLESLRGAERSKRLRVLSGNQSVGTWLTIVGSHIEGALSLGFLLLLLYLIPENLLPDDIWRTLGNDASWLDWLGRGFWLLAMSLFAPFYVAGGFALYLTRRSILEAWDLELAFRRMEPRFRGDTGASGRRRVAAAIVASLLLLISALPFSDSHAAETTLTRSEAQSVIKEVLADEAFGTKKTEKYWKYIGKTDEPKEDKSPKRDFAWLGGLAEFLEYLLWIGLAVVVGWLIYYLAQLADWLPQRRKSGGENKPSVLFGLPITPESLPQDVMGAIAALVGEGRLRAALSLLYRATLMRLVHDHHLKIPDSATEGECQRLVRSQRPDGEAGFFDSLTRLWVNCAYGHVLPAAHEITDLSQAWHALYEEAADE